MAQKPESRLQRRVQDALRAAFPGCYVRKIHVSEYSAAGTPDLICCIHGLFVAVEVKMPGAPLSKLQEYEQAEIAKAGGIAILAYSPEQAVEQCRAALKDSNDRK